MVLNAAGFRLSPDCKRMLVRRHEGPVSLHILPECAAVQQWPVAKAPARDMAFSEDGSLIVIGADNGTVEVFAASDGQRVRRLPRTDGASPIKGLVVSPTASCSVPTDSGLILRSDIETGTELRPIVGTEGLTADGASSDGRVAAVAIDEGPVRLLDIETSQLIAEFSGPSLPVSRVRFAPDSSALVAGGDDGMLCVWPLDGALRTTSDPWSEVEHLVRIGQNERAASRFAAIRSDVPDRFASPAIVAALGMADRAADAVAELARLRESQASRLYAGRSGIERYAPRFHAELARAVEASDDRRVEALLSADPSLANAAVDDGEPALLVAAGRRDGRMVRRLLAAGADPEIAGARGWTALHEAAAAC